MSQVNKIVFECVDAALSRFDFVDKNTFYEYLGQNHNLDFSQFADRFDTVHQALDTVYGVNHFQIERAIIRILNERARSGVYPRNDEIAAFSCMVNTFIQETEKSISRHKTIAAISIYARDLENKVKEANDRLKNSERMAAIGETAAMVGHDIRNPLQSIVGELYLQKEELASLPESSAKSNLRDSIRSIEENIFYINKIVSDLQDIARPLHSEENEEVDINQIIAEVLSIVPIPQNMQVQIQVDDDFPMLQANNQMLKRAITNLVQNAVQAMPDGGKLTIRASYAYNKPEIIVEDTGDGIPDDVKSRLFKPLFTTKAKGQGLGLAVVKRLVEAQGGTVSVESQVGKGAKFIIYMSNSAGKR